MENIIDNIKSILEARSSTKEHVSECDQKLSEFNTMLMDVDTELNVTKVLSGQNKSLMDLSYNAKKYVDKESSNIMMEAKKIYNDCREIGECSRINYDFFLKCDILHNELEEKLTQSINEHNLKLIEVQEQSDRLKKELEDGIVEHNETLSGLEKEVTECENNVQSLCKLIDQENSYLQCLNVDEKTRENNDLLEGISQLTIQLESIDNSMNNYNLQLEELNCEFNKEIREREAVKKLLAEDNEKMQTEYTTLMTNPNEENNLLDDCKSKITNAIKIKTEKNENLSDINNSIQSMECEIENISHLLESEIPLKVESVDKLRNCVFTEESLIRELSQELKTVHEDATTIQNDIETTKQNILEWENKKSSTEVALDIINKENDDCEKQLSSIEENLKFNLSFKEDCITKYSDLRLKNEIILADKKHTLNNLKETLARHFELNQKEYNELEQENKKLTGDIEEMQVLLTKLENDKCNLIAQKQVLFEAEENLDKQSLLMKTEIQKRQKLIKGTIKRPHTHVTNKKNPVTKSQSSDDSGF